MVQVARNLANPFDGFLLTARYLIHDRSPLFTRQFASILKSAGVETVKLPPRSQNLNAYAAPARPSRFYLVIPSAVVGRFLSNNLMMARNAPLPADEGYGQIAVGPGESKKGVL
jgi:hypothetical protein